MDRIFVLDDSALSLTALSRLLEAEGYEVLTRGQSEGAIEAIAEAAPDLALLDIVMPKVSGLEVLQGIKRREECADMPVIMVTAKTDVMNLSAALEAGAFDYIRKPFEPVEVAARVRSALRTRDYLLKLRHLAERDGLTGLLNHTAFYKALDKELGSGEAPIISVAMIDLDLFKSVNDRFGHQAGDLVLKGFAQLLQSAVGPSGAAARYGGEEFCVFLKGYGPEMAERWAQTFRKAIEGYSWDVAGKQIRVTVSIGVVAFDRHRGSESLVASADASLYEAKRSGRNRVAVSGRGQAPG
jgi:two-component system cell cycle response regulator